MKVFFLEDDTDIAELIRFNLMLKGIEAQGFTTGMSFLEKLAVEKPDLVLVDLMLPDMGGLEVCKKIRGDKSLKKLPIIIVSAKGEEEDVVKGLEVGADDYLSKPFSPKVLLARIFAVYRRSQIINKEDPYKEDVNKGEVLEFGELKIHLGKREVKVSGKPISLTRSEFQILHFLAKRPGWVFTRSQIVDAIHGENYAVTERAIDFQMVGLRKKIGEFGGKIQTVRGVGYRFQDDSLEA